MLTKLDNNKILVSLETIKYLEQVPDTIVFFTNGESVFIKETLEEVEKAVEEHSRRINGATAT
ncbi:MAG: flagellar FlbD family protein [Pseudobacteriovorax sp.]|nr:flagellar FlbD family protein [Pseudobacteriovorax sp.]